MADSALDLPSALRRLRSLLAITQVGLATALGVTPTSVHRYEAGTSKPSPIVLKALLGMINQLGDRKIISETERNLLARAVEPESNILIHRKGDALHLSQSRPRPLLDIKQLAALAPEDHDVLEAVMSLLKSRDSTAKRILTAVIEPWLPKREAGS